MGLPEASLWNHLPKKARLARCVVHQAQGWSASSGECRLTWPAVSTPAGDVSECLTGSAYSSQGCLA